MGSQARRETVSLIPSPRAAKRFSNVYRILRARVRREELAQFEGTEEVPGGFQVPMLLLALLIGAPAESALLFPQLIAAASPDDIVEVLQGSQNSKTRSPNLVGLRNKIQPVVCETAFPNEPELFRDWIPLVARFSFELGWLSEIEPANTRLAPVNLKTKTSIRNSIECFIQASFQKEAEPCVPGL